MKISQAALERCNVCGRSQKTLYVMHKTLPILPWRAYRVYDEPGSCGLCCKQLAAGHEVEFMKGHA
jgi:hypothetical protein